MCCVLDFHVCSSLTTFFSELNTVFSSSFLVSVFITQLSLFYLDNFFKKNVFVMLVNEDHKTQCSHKYVHKYAHTSKT